MIALLEILISIFTANYAGEPNPGDPYDPSCCTGNG
jgi:hypothetical protein